MQRGHAGPSSAPPEREAQTPAEPPSRPAGPWQPREPQVDEAAGFAWATVELESACEIEREAKDSASRVTVISDAAEFEATFCRTADLDWSRFRVVAFALRDHIVDLALSRTDEQYRVLATTRASCDAFTDAHVHLLLPADGLPIAVVRKPAPPPDCPDGYGY